MGLLLATSLCIGEGAFAQSAQPASAEVTWRLLDYVAVDYASAVADDGRIINDAEYREMEEFSATIRAQLAELPARPQLAALIAEADELRGAIERKARPSEVAAQARAMGDKLLDAYPTRLAPSAVPDLARAAALYSEQCAVCHGVRGDGAGPGAAGLDPPPVAFTDAARARERSVFGLYQVIGQGLEGTAMTSFAHLPSSDRWGLAFYIGQLASSEEDAARGERLWRSNAQLRARFPNLQAVTEPTPAALAAELGEANATAVVAYLRRRPEATAAQGSTLAVARARLEDSVRAYERGDRRAATRFALSAYLDGFEPVEPALTARDAALMRRVESAMAAFRADIGRGAAVPELRAKQAQVLVLLDAAERRLEPTQADAGANFFGAFMILLREGLEAILIVVAMLVFLQKAERRDLLPYVHGGWLAALVAGLATWGAATYLISISGASRELTEGVGSLIAAVVLVSVGIWMHGRSQAQAWQTYIHEKLSRALSGRSAWFLFLLAFLVVYREVFETILFYVALWAQGGGWAMLAGAGAGAVCLAAIARLLMAYSRRLPISKFFAYSSVLIAILAVVLAGKGIAALQEAGWIDVRPAAFIPRIDILGLFPTWEGVLGQTLVLMLLAAGFWLSGRAAQARG